MKPMLIVGVIMIVLGGAILAYRGFSYRSEEKIIDLGPLQATAQTEKRVPLPPALGWALVGGGILVSGGAFVMGKKS